MKQALAIFFISVACMAPTCTPPVVPVDFGPDADCSERARKCPPCECADVAPSPTPEPQPEAAPPPPTTPCGTACLTLAALGCPEANPACVQVCEHVTSSHITAFNTACIIKASSVAAVRKCPAIKCASVP